MVVLPPCKLHLYINLPFLMSYFDEADSENHGKKREKKNRFRESLISRIEEFEGFRENKISRTEASSVFTFREILLF